jgi:hypothetical protein
MPHGLVDLFAEEWPKLLVATNARDAHARACKMAGAADSWPQQRARAHSQSCAPAASVTSLGWASPSHEQLCSSSDAASTGAQGQRASPACLGVSNSDCALDAPFAQQAAASAWRDIPVSEEDAFMQLHIADRFWQAVQEAERAFPGSKHVYPACIVA